MKFFFWRYQREDASVCGGDGGPIGGRASPPWGRRIGLRVGELPGRGVDVNTGTRLVTWRPVQCHFSSTTNTPTTHLTLTLRLDSPVGPYLILEPPPPSPHYSYFDSAPLDTGLNAYCRCTVSFYRIITLIILAYNTHNTITFACSFLSNRLAASCLKISFNSIASQPQ